MVFQQREKTVPHKGKISSGLCKNINKIKYSWWFSNKTEKNCPTKEKFLALVRSIGIHRLQKTKKEKYKNLLTFERRSEKMNAKTEYYVRE